MKWWVNDRMRQESASFSFLGSFSRFLCVALARVRKTSTSTIATRRLERNEAYESLPVAARAANPNYRAWRH